MNSSIPSPTAAFRLAAFGLGTSIVGLTACAGDPANSPVDDEAAAVVRAALEYIRSEHHELDSVAAGYGVPFRSSFEPDEAVSEIASSLGFDVCVTSSDCPILVGRPGSDEVAGRAELVYTTRSRVAGMGSVTIWHLDLTSDDGTWGVEHRREVSHFETG